jgi:hypothetical protein
VKDRCQHAVVHALSDVADVVAEVNAPLRLPLDPEKERERAKDDALRRPQFDGRGHRCVNERGFWDVAAISNAPLVATHSNAHALSPHSRNLTDKQLAAIRETAGLVGINFATSFLRPDGSGDAVLPRKASTCANGVQVRLIFVPVSEAQVRCFPSCSIRIE